METKKLQDMETKKLQEMISQQIDVIEKELLENDTFVTLPHVSIDSQADALIALTMYEEVDNLIDDLECLCKAGLIRRKSFRVLLPLPPYTGQDDPTSYYNPDSPFSDPIKDTLEDFHEIQDPFCTLKAIVNIACTGIHILDAYFPFESPKERLKIWCACQRVIAWLKSDNEIGVCGVYALFKRDVIK